MKAIYWILGTLGTILLGAIGSGMWELALKPVSHWCKRIAGHLMSLGMTRLRNRLYEDAARREIERSAQFIVYIVTLFCVGVLSQQIFRMIHPYQDTFDEEIRQLDKQAGKPSLTTEEKAVFSDHLADLRQRVDQIKHRLRIQLVAIDLLIIGFFGFHYLRLAYVASVISHFERCVQICLPFFQNHEQAEVRSRFARICTQEDYVKVLGTLNSVALRGNITLPSKLLL